MSWPRVLIFCALAACSSRTPGERERALERIPAQADWILAADGSALAGPVFRATIDALGSHVPPQLACVVDVATASGAIAIGVQVDVGTTIAIVTRGEVRCPALSRLAAGVWVATIGAGAPAASRGASVLGADGWARARPYLLREPVAVAAELPQLRLVAVAQPEPIDAWLAIDAGDAAGVERTIKDMLARWQSPMTIELAGKLAVTRKGSQVSVAATGLTSEDLAAIIEDTIRIAEMPAAAPTIAARFACPQPGNGIVSCHDGTQYKVTSVATLVGELAGVQAAPVIAGGDIVGIRLIGEPTRLLQRDDVILGVDSHAITDARQLAALAPSLDGKVSIAVRRDGVEAVLELSE